MPAPKGNDYAKKWPTPKDRQGLCSRFCRHIAQGFSMESFPDASPKTIRAYAKSHPEDFPPEKLEEAARRGLLWWEKLGRDGASGKIKQFNATSWIFNMKNRAGWRDRTQIEDISPKGSEAPGDATSKVKPRSTGEIALSMLALMAKAEHEEKHGDGDNVGATGGKN